MGVVAHGVDVEADVVRGLPGFEVIGLPEAAVKESRVRVRAALEANGFEMPDRRVLINLAPGDLKKSGSGFDLAIGLSVLAVCGACPVERLGDVLVLGELGLSGELRAVRGVVAQLRAAMGRGVKRAVVPACQSSEADLVAGMEVHVASHLREVIWHFNGQKRLPTARDLVCDNARTERCDEGRGVGDGVTDVCSVRGQRAALRALEIAAVGNHHMLMYGPPGSGKSMLASCLPGILPAPSPEQALEIATICSAAGQGVQGPLEAVQRPFRSPHCSASVPALVGGGDPVRPGEVTLAHGGVLFVDEFPEFRRDAIESLRTTMTEGEVEVVRVNQRVVMPAAPLLVAAMNPCPCGYHGEADRVCRCSPERIRRYVDRISGPILDRFDLHVPVRRVAAHELRSSPAGTESSAAVRDRVCAAVNLLSQIPPASLEHPQATDAALSFLDSACERTKLSARSYVSVLRVARTIAAMGGERVSNEGHVAEALRYRPVGQAQESSGFSQRKAGGSEQWETTIN